MDVVLLFPGQGSQKPGMGKDVAAEFSSARDVFDRADAALGMSLSRLCFEGPADELTLTNNAQPALVAHGAALWAATRDVIGASVMAPQGTPGRIHGVSLGDVAGRRDAVRLARRRGELMLESASHARGLWPPFSATPIVRLSRFEQATMEAGPSPRQPTHPANRAQR
jgi:[acyl-carrier-protein] S-malonyltransferase